MKIITLTAENVKKLVAVEIKPDGNLVQITGKNGQGKTSVLDSIWWALAGTTHIQAAPIRQGETKARIRLDMGEIVVTRTFEQKDGAPATSKIVVENADGMRAPSPQRMLDGLLGALSFDPLAFTRMPAREQFDTLKRFVPGVDFAAIEKANKADYDARTDLNRRAKEARSAALSIAVPADLPPAPINDSDLVQALENAATHNGEIETRRVRREATARDADNAERAVTGIEIAAADLRRRAEALIAEATEKDREAADARQHVAGLRKLIADAPPLPEPIDTAKVREQIEQARTTNAQIAKRQQRNEHTARAEKLEAESKALTEAMAKREKDKAKAIATAALPVPGIGFGDGAITLAGLPFDQASDAEQLRASIAIAMAMNPKLRVIRVRDGSLLDEDALKLLGEMAADKDYQVWIERVDSSGKVGFVLEDGMLKADAAAEAA